MRTIEEVTKEFGEKYEAAKTSEASKKKLQAEFFTLATESLNSGSLARKIVTMPKGTVSHKGDWERWVTIYHPGWRFVDFKGDSAYDMIIEEDPALLPFVYMNARDGLVYGRTTASGAPQLDDERLREEDPDLWERISDWPEPWFSLVFDVYDSMDVLNPKGHTVKFLKAKEVQRVLRPIESLSDEALEALQEYLVPAPISVRLVPPRPMKEDE